MAAKLSLLTLAWPAPDLLYVPIQYFYRQLEKLLTKQFDIPDGAPPPQLLGDPQYRHQQLAALLCPWLSQLPTKTGVWFLWVMPVTCYLVPRLAVQRARTASELCSHAVAGMLGG